MALLEQIQRNAALLPADKQIEVLNFISILSKKSCNSRCNDKKGLSKFSYSGTILITSDSTAAPAILLVKSCAA